MNSLSHFLISILIFFYIFSFSFSHKMQTRKLSESIITFRANSGKVQFATSATAAKNKINSITVNGEPIEINKDYTATKDDTEFVIIYKQISDCSSLLFNNLLITYVDLSKFDSAPCTTMAAFFSKCNILTSINFGENFDTSNVLNMKSMFDSCTLLTSVDICKFDTSKVTDMSGMFASSGIVLLDMSCLNTASVTTMNKLFYKCDSLLSVDLSNLKTSKLTNIGSMFENCFKIISIQLTM